MSSSANSRSSKVAAGDPVLPGAPVVDAALEQSLRKALAQRGPGYQPRTHHLHADGRPKYVNRLVLETSPYLLQHAHNPVNFFPWGPEALARAKALGKPILLSIGYSTCHWCHVMERESFEDEEIAAYLNAHYVSIKVDREERPDLDDVYMAAVQMLTGRGGWPMTVVLTPDLKPFFGGTYFPPRDGVRGAKTGFLSILKALHRSFTEEPDKVAEHAERVSQAMVAASAPQRPGSVPGYSFITAAAQALAQRFDPVHGGFGRAPKFPQPDRVALLLRHFRRTGDEGALRMVVRTLRAMAAGGMHDQVGGGFHRYSTDARWLVPHFEKMLYDNALLARVYLEAFQATGDAELARVARSTLAYVAREMTSADGTFYSATDADSDTGSGHQEEGYHFTWTRKELNDILTADELELAEQLFDLPEHGNFEGRIILALARPKEAVAKQLNVSLAALQQRLDGIQEKLYRARQARTYPGRDDKTLTAWNALMISAFAQASWVLGDANLSAIATRAAEGLWTHLRDPEGTLLRSRMDGKARQPAFLDDHAFFVAALLDLFETTWDPTWLRRAVALQREQDAHFWDAGAGGYFMTRDDAEILLVRDKPHYDGAVPSGNAVAAHNLLRLADLTADMTHRARAEQVLATFDESMRKNPLGAMHMLAALDRYLDVTREVIITHPAASDPAPLVTVAREVYLPNRLVVMASDEHVSALADQVPMLQDKISLTGAATAYVCERGRCELPTQDPAVLRQQLSKRNPLSPKPSALVVPPLTTR